MQREGKGENGGLPETITHNLRGSSKDWVRQFYQNESFRQGNNSSIKLYHEIISFSNRDTGKITNEILRDITQKYISLRGETGMFVAAFHTSGRDHQHIHLAVSGLHYKTGQAMRLSKADLLHLRQELQRYQIEKYPQLGHSLPEHGKGLRYKANPEWQMENKKGSSIKSEIAKKVQTLFEQSSSRNEFYAKLEKEELFPYERGSRVGVCYGNTKYRLERLGIDDKQFQDLPVDISEREHALREIQALREERKSQEREIEEDIPDYSEEANDDSEIDRDTDEDLQPGL